MTVYQCYVYCHRRLKVWLDHVVARRTRILYWNVNYLMWDWGGANDFDVDTGSIQNMPSIIQTLY